MWAWQGGGVNKEHGARHGVCGVHPVFLFLSDSVANSVTSAQTHHNHKSKKKNANVLLLNMNQQILQP